MRTLKFKITAKVTKIVEVEVDDTNLSYEEAEDVGREMAHEAFNPQCDGYEEEYSEESFLVK